MRIVVDTNVLLVSISLRSRMHPIFQHLISGKAEWVVTHEILMEYLEIIEQQSNRMIASNIESVIRKLPNVISPGIYYQFNLIASDPDDNKFTDAYLAAGADLLVTNDRHFEILRNIPFPKINLIAADDFLSMITAN